MNFLLNFYSINSSVGVLNIIITLIFISGIIVSYKDIMNIIRNIINSFIEEEVEEELTTVKVYNDIVINRSTADVIWEEEVRFLNESINNITKDYIKAFITKNRIDQNTRLPIYDSDYVKHIDDIFTGVMESLSDNYIYRLKFYFYKNPEKDFKLMIKKVYMSEINALKERKIIMAREEFNKGKQDMVMNIISVLDEAGVQGISTDIIESVIDETKGLSEEEIATLRESSLDSTRSIIQQFETIQTIAKEKGVNLDAIDSYLKDIK